MQVTNRTKGVLLLIAVVILLGGYQTQIGVRVPLLVTQSKHADRFCNCTPVWTKTNLFDYSPHTALRVCDNELAPEIPTAQHNAAARLRRHIAAFAENNTIILAETNSGFADMTINWMRSLRHVGLTNFVVICLDSPCAIRFAELGIPNAFYDEALWTDALPIDHRAQLFRRPAYNAIVHNKLLLAKLVLQLGFSVFLSDVDVVFYRSPFPEIEALPYCDFYAATDSEGSIADWERSLFPGDGFKYWLNTGVMFLRPTNPTLKMLRVALSGPRPNDGLDDQSHFNQWLNALSVQQLASTTQCAIYRMQTDDIISFSVLHPRRFPDGKHELNPLWMPVLLHVNYLDNVESKRDRLRSEGQWNPCML